MHHSTAHAASSASASVMVALALAAVLRGIALGVDFVGGVAFVVEDGDFLGAEVVMSCIELTRINGIDRWSVDSGEDGVKDKIMSLHRVPSAIQTTRTLVNAVHEMITGVSVETHDRDTMKVSMHVVRTHGIRLEQRSGGARCEE